MCRSTVKINMHINCAFLVDKQIVESLYFLNEQFYVSNLTELSTVFLQLVSELVGNPGVLYRTSEPIHKELHYPSSENKGADQLCSYCTADLRLCFRKCKNLVFS